MKCPRHEPKPNGSKVEQLLNDVYNQYDYDPVSGVLKNNQYGNVAGKFPKVGGDKVSKSRLIWTMMTGEEPRGQFVVFRNGNRKDFRWENLALSNRSTSPLEAQEADYQQHTALKGVKAAQLSDPEFLMKRAVVTAISELPHGEQLNAMSIEDVILSLADYALRMCVPRKAIMPNLKELDEQGIDKEFYESRYQLASSYTNPFRENEK